MHEELKKLMDSGPAFLGLLGFNPDFFECRSTDCASLVKVLAVDGPIACGATVHSRIGACLVAGLNRLSDPELFELLLQAADCGYPGRGDQQYQLMGAAFFALGRIVPTLDALDPLRARAMQCLNPYRAWTRNTDYLYCQGARWALSEIEPAQPDTSATVRKGSKTRARKIAT